MGILECRSAKHIINRQRNTPICIYNIYKLYNLVSCIQVAIVSMYVLSLCNNGNTYITMTNS